MRAFTRSTSSAALALGLVGVFAFAGCGDKGQQANAEDVISNATVAPTEAGEAADTSAPAKSSAEKPERIAFGERVALSDHLAEGQITVFDFMSDYCGPCKQIAPLMDRIHRERPDITVVKVDINRPEVRGIDWQSPVAQQYQMRSIPHFKIYAADGSLMAEGQQAGGVLQQWFNELMREQG